MINYFQKFEEGRSLKHDEPLSAYFRYDSALYVSYSVILYKDKVVVPLSLRPRILNKLHSVHQGVTSMHARTQQIVFWPGITQDIESIREKSRSFNQNFPSQPSLPQKLSDTPTSPFEKIFADFSSLLETIF